MRKYKEKSILWGAIFLLLILLFYFIFWQAQQQQEEVNGTQSDGEWWRGNGVVTEFRHFFKCSLYYDIGCRTIFLYVNKFLCNITQFANVQRKSGEGGGRREEG